MSVTRSDASPTLRSVLRDDERLLWRGTPHRRRLLLDAVRVIGPALGVLAMIGLFVTWVVALSVEFSGGDPTALLPYVVAAAVVVVLVVVVGALWVATRRYANAEYAATDERLISFSGAFGRDHSSVGWGSVRDLEVTVDALDGLFGTGTIYVATEGRGDVTFRYLERPHDLAAELDAIRSGGERTADTPDESPATTGTTQPSSMETRPGVGQGTGTPAGAGTTGTAEHRTRREATARAPGPGADEVSATLRGLLHDGEEVRWHYRPPTGTYLKQSLLGGLLAGLILWSIFYGLFIGVPVLAEFGPFVESTLGVSAVIAVAAGWVVVQVVWLLALGGGVYSASDRLEFVATDRRAIKVGGWVGLDTSAVEWTNTNDIEVERNLMTHLFGTGNLVVRTGGGGRTYRGGGLRFGPVVDPMAALERIEAIRRGEDGGEPILIGGGGGTSRPTPAVRTPDVSALSAQARTMLRDGETLLWRGTPSFVPFVVPRLVGGIVFAAAGAVTLWIGWGGLFSLLVLLSGLSTAGKRLLTYRNAEYVATDQRVVAFGGGLGRDSSSVDWSDVHDVEVTTGAVDGPFDTGTLRFSRAGRATPAERAEAGGESEDAFTGVQFRRVPDARAVAEVLEQGRGT